MIKLVDEFEAAGIFFGLENFKLYCQFAKDLLEREQLGFRDEYRRRIEELGSDARAGYETWQADAHFYLFDALPALQWLSLFNTAHSILEKNMDYICTLAQRKTNTKFSLSDINGKGIERAKRYLNIAAAVNDPFTSQSWQLIKKYAGLRNMMIYAGGEIDSTNIRYKEILQFASEHQHIEIYRYNTDSIYVEIRLGPEIVLESIGEYASFLRLLAEHNLPES